MDNALASLEAKLDELVKFMSYGNPNRIFSIDEAVRYFGIGYKRFTDAISKGELPFYKINERDTSLRQKDIEDWIMSKKSNYGRDRK